MIFNAWFKKRPWIWIVVLLAASMIADFILLWIASRDSPTLLQ